MNILNNILCIQPIEYTPLGFIKIHMQGFIQYIIPVTIEQGVDYNVTIFSKLTSKCSVLFRGWCYKVPMLKIFNLNLNEGFIIKKKACNYCAFRLIRKTIHVMQFRLPTRFSNKLGGDAAKIIKKQHRMIQTCVK